VSGSRMVVVIDHSRTPQEKRLTWAWTQVSTVRQLEREKAKGLSGEPVR